VWTVFDNGKMWLSRAWVPPGPEPVRGIFIFGNGLGNDERIAVIDDWWLTFCACIGSPWWPRLLRFD